MDALELKISFLDQAAQQLYQAEAWLQVLESQANSTEAKNQIFDILQKLKQSAQPAGFKDLLDLAEQYESLLLKLRNQDLRVDSHIFQLLVRCFDRFFYMLNELKTDLSKKFNNSDLIHEVGVVLSKDFVQKDTTPLSNQMADLTQNYLKPLKPKTSSSTDQNPSVAIPVADEMIQVSISRLDQLISTVAELSAINNIFQNHKNSIESKFLQMKMLAMKRVSQKLHSLSFGLRMSSVQAVFQELQKSVETKSEHLGKKIEVVISGLNTELDRSLLGELKKFLDVCFRYCLKYSFEDRSEGQIQLSAKSNGSKVSIEISDNGCGKDPHLNFSQFQWEVEVESQPGSGTRIRAELPLSIQLMEGLLVSIGKDQYVIPASQVEESIQLTSSLQSESLDFHGQMIPLFPLGQVLKQEVSPSSKEDSVALVIRKSNKPYSVVVDEVITRQQMVIRSLGEELQGISGISGGVVLENGKVALILDFLGLQEAG